MRDTFSLAFGSVISAIRSDCSEYRSADERRPEHPAGRCHTL